MRWYKKTPEKIYFFIRNEIYGFFLFPRNGSQEGQMRNIHIGDPFSDLSGLPPELPSRCAREVIHEKEEWKII